MKPTRKRNPASKLLDASDLQILEIIQTRGRISKKALAQAIGLSSTPCSLRLQRLERAGFIRGYRGTVDTQRLGTLLWAHTAVTLSRHRAPDFQRFEDAIRPVREIIECNAVGGGIDYILRIVARDVTHYQQIIERLLAAEIGIHSYFTYIVTKQVKEPTAIPVSLLAREESSREPR